MSCCPDGSLLIVGDKKGILYIIDTDIKEIVFSFVSKMHFISLSLFFSLRLIFCNMNKNTFFSYNISVCQKVLSLSHILGLSHTSHLCMGLTYAGI